MKVINITNVDDAVTCPRGAFRSYRFLTKKDGMGYTVTKTVIPRGGPHRWQYKNHLESCYCVSGLGYLVNEATGEDYYIHPDTLYALDKHDAHLFIAITDVVLICVFSPALAGDEVHQEDGSYGV